MKDEVSENYLPTKLARTSSFRLPPSSFPLVPLAVPFWNGDTYRAIARAFLSGAIIDGLDLDALKSSLIDRLGVVDAALCGSGSLALELALRDCGVEAGNEVVIPAFCCSAVVPPIAALGAIPVLADVGEELNLTVDTVDAVITRKTKAVIVPHLFGNPADIRSIVELARAKNIRVVDDAAQALGATIGGQAAGGFGDVGIVSFGNEKVCFGIGGGAVLVNQPELVADRAWNLIRARPAPVMKKLTATEFAWRRRRWTLALQRALRSGANGGPAAAPTPYRREAMANLQAAVAMSLMRTLSENIAARRARVHRYRELLGGEDRLELIGHRPGSACLTQVVRVLPKSRGQDTASATIEALGAAGYEVHGSYVPIHLLGVFHRCVWDRLARAERLWADLIELPCGPDVALDQVTQVAAIVKAGVHS